MGSEPMLELNVCDLSCEPELAALRGLHEREAWTVDSGASQSVANKKSFPGVVVRESAGSRAGQKYKGPGTDVIANEGEFDTLSAMESGARAKVTFQSAEIRKPLVAVSGLVDKGNLTIFDQKSFVIPSSAPEVEMIRQLVAKARGKIPLHRERGIYKMRNWEISSTQPTSGFPRPGK